MWTYLAGVDATLLVSGAQHVAGDRTAVVIGTAAGLIVHIRHERLLQQVRAARPLHVAPPAQTIKRSHPHKAESARVPNMNSLL